MIHHILQLFLEPSNSTTQCIFLSNLFFFNFLLVLCELHILHTYSSPHSFVSTLCPCNTPQIKQIFKQSLFVEAVVCHSEPRTISFSSLIFTANVIAMNHCSDSRLLAWATLSVQNPQWDSSWICCCCPVSWRPCSFGSTGLVPSTCFSSS